MQTVLHYRRRAEELRRLADFGLDQECMELAQTVVTTQAADCKDFLCANASALLYVHAGISMADAILVFLTGIRSTAQSHSEAARKLQKACGKKQKSTDGIKHFEWLVQNKDYFAYDDKHVTLNDAKLAKTKIDRFLTWAFTSFPEIATND